MNDFVTELGIDEWSDQECLDVFTELLSDRVEIGTGFIVTQPSNFITHQVIELTSGDIHTTSAPSPLEIPLQVAAMADFVPANEIN